MGRRTARYSARDVQGLIDARSKGLAGRIATVLNGYRIAQTRGDRRLRKAAETGDPSPHLVRLERLLRNARKGMALDQASRSVRLTGSPTVRATDIIKIDVLAQLLEGSGETAEDILRESQRQIDAVIQRVLREAASSTPRPSDSATARRLRSELAALADLTFERASRIARTEMGIAANTGFVAGYEAAGVEELEWMAFRDGRSGDRHHERMHGKRVKLGELFTLPSGARMRYPLDPQGPVGEIVNCRCTIRARRGGRSKT